MRQINIPVHIYRLKALGNRFEDFRTELTSTTPLTGTDGLGQLTRHIRISHELTLEALTRLTVINGSQATQMTGALTALDCLAQTVHHAGLVSESLTAANAANAYDATSWDPPADTDTIGRGLQHLHARDPLTLGDLQQWLGHKHPASTRYYAKILQRTLTAAYRKADYFARNIRTIEVLIDRDSVLTGAAGRRRTALEVLRPGRRLLQLRLLRQVPPPHGLRPLPLLRPQGVDQGPAPRGQGRHQQDARTGRPHRRRARSTRR